MAGSHKLGLINDKRLIRNVSANGSHSSKGNDTETHVDAGDISYHFVQFIPSHRDFLDPETELQRMRKRSNTMFLELNLKI